MFKDKTTLHSCSFEKNFTDDLSSVKEGTSNLLHLAISNGRSTDAVKFFYYWKVDAFTEKDNANLTALDLAASLDHPAKEFLERKKTETRTREVEIKNRQTYLETKLSQLRKKHNEFDASFTMRTGEVECGRVAFIPELGCYRVVDGEYGDVSLEQASAKGVQEYDVATKTMSHTFGTITEGNKHFNFFGTQRPKPRAARRQLKVGCAYYDRSAESENVASDESVIFYSEHEKSMSVYGVSDVEQADDPNTDFFQATLSVGIPYRDQAEKLEVDRDACLYFEEEVFISKSEFLKFRRAIGTQRFASLDLRVENIACSKPPETRYYQACKYLIASCRYLRGWQNAIAEANADEKSYLDKYARAFTYGLAQCLDNQHRELHNLISVHDPAISMPALYYLDSSRQCVLRYIAFEYACARNLGPAPFRTLLRRRLLELPNTTASDRAIARDLAG